MSPLHVLAIDDDPFVRDLVADMLAPPRFHVRVAPDGELGLAALDEDRPDLILLDVDLGHGADGFEICRQIHTRADPPPVIFLTGQSDTADHDRGYAAGAAAYLCKPFSPLQLLDTIRTLRKTP